MHCTCLTVFIVYKWISCVCIIIIHITCHVFHQFFRKENLYQIAHTHTSNWLSLFYLLLERQTFIANAQYTFHLALKFHIFKLAKNYAFKFPMQGASMNQLQFSFLFVLFKKRDWNSLHFIQFNHLIRGVFAQWRHMCINFDEMKWTKNGIIAIIYQFG